MHTACLLTLMLTCQPKAVSALTVAHVAVAFSDTWATQRVFTLARHNNFKATEDNPLTRPFQSHGKPLAYASTYAGLVGLSWVETKMRTSKSWTWKIWWAPRVVLIGASAVGFKNNTVAYRSNLDSLTPANKYR